MSLCGFIPICRCLDKGEQYWANGCTKKEAWNGPGIVCIGPCYNGTKRNGITLLPNEYIRIKDTVNGNEHVITGPSLYFLKAYEEEVDRRPVSGELLGPTDYLKIMDKNTGEITVEKGPQLWMPKSPYQVVSKKLTAVALKHYEYVKIIDKKSGTLRLERGESLVYLGPHEEIVDQERNNGVKAAVNVDEHTAVLVRDSTNGQLRLVTEKKLFFPKATEEIQQVQKKIVLEDHQVIVLKDKDGNYMIKEGSARLRPKGKKEEVKETPKEDPKSDPKSPKDEKKKKTKSSANIITLSEDDDGSFFIPPYCELVQLKWFTSDDVKENEVAVSYFDMRPQFMTYGFSCRTVDNVELTIDLTFFWEITDVSQMIRKTDDLPSDICNHARSIIIQEVSQVTMEKFMSQFNIIIARAVLERPDPFYQERGARVLSVEVRAIHCRDPATEKVLQEIIKETTDRLNRLQKQASENEVRLFKMKGDIECEKMNGDLLKIKHDHHRAEALMEGEAQADMIKSFLKGLETANVPFEIQVSMWQTLQKMESVDGLSEGNSQLFFTPADIKLSIETLSTGGLKKPLPAPNNQNK